jgi:hypothetical protein
MKSNTRVKFVLLGIASGLMVAFAWNAARGQMRLPRPPMPGGRPLGPNMNPPGMPGLGGPRIVKVWRCTGCGGEIGRGLNAPPNTCPHCGARIVNGIGNGIPQPGMGNNPTLPVTPPGFNPNPAGPVNPPEFNPVAPPGANDVQPVVNAPPFNPNGGNPSEVNTGSGFKSDDSSSSSSGGARKALIIALVVGIIVVGVSILLGGTFLMIYVMKRNGSSAPRRRRRRDEDYDDRS